jgi:WD40 repeat protein
VWNLRTGAPLGKPLRGQTGVVNAVATGEVDGVPVAVSGDSDGTLRVWNLRTGAARGDPLRGHKLRVQAVAAGEVDGVSVAVSGDDKGTISMWALDHDQHASAHLEAPAGINAIATASQVGWLTSTRDGSLFIWRPAPASGRASRQS